MMTLLEGVLPRGGDHTIGRSIAKGKCPDDTVGCTCVSLQSQG